MARLTKPWSQAECDYLNRYVKADFETGLLYWKQDSPNGRYKAGQQIKTSLAGPGGAKYHSFKAKSDTVYKPFRVHHVIWFLATGKQSELWLDHIDRDKLNNRLSNLREATPSQNQINTIRPRTRNKHLSCKGVNSRVKGEDKQPYYWSTINCEGVPLYLGQFDTEREAGEAYDRASIILHGDYGCRNYPDDTYTPESLEQTRVLLRNSLQKKQAILSGVCI